MTPEFTPAEAARIRTQSLLFGQAACTKDRVGFEDWLLMLDRVASAAGYPGGAPCSSTGPSCWRDSYDEGLTPEEALLLDDETLD